MLSMARGGTYDHVEGGFFRYSTTRDWSVPHFEKMAEDHAGLLRVLSSWCFTRPPTSFAKRWFRRRTTCAAFYAIHKLDSSREVKTPTKPTTSCRSRNAASARRRMSTAPRTRIGPARSRARSASRRARSTTTPSSSKRCRRSIMLRSGSPARDGLLFHVLAPGDAPAVSGLLADQVAYARALLDAHEISGEARFLSRAQSLVDAVIANFESPEGGFYDRLRGDDDFGRLAVADRPIVDNGLFAEVLLRMAGLTAILAIAKARESVLGVLAARGAGAFRGDLRSRAAPVSLPGALGSHRRRAGRDGRLSRSGATPSDTLCGDPHALTRSRGAARDAGGAAGCIRMRYRSVRRSGSRCGRPARRLRCARCVSSFLPLLDVHADDEKPQSSEISPMLSSSSMEVPKTLPTAGATKSAKLLVRKAKPASATRTPKVRGKKRDLKMR